MVRGYTRILIAALLVVGVLAAKDRWKEDALVDGETVNRSVSTVVHSVPWHDDIENALAEAQRLHRAVLWLHALGELDGST